MIFNHPLNITKVAVHELCKCAFSCLIKFHLDAVSLLLVKLIISELLLAGLLYCFTNAIPIGILLSFLKFDKRKNDHPPALDPIQNMYSLYNAYKQMVIPYPNQGLLVK